MKDTALYEHLLGLKTPWSVKKVDLSLAEQRVVVEVVLKKGQVWADPTDAIKRAHINGWTERQWRHLDTCQSETLIKARVPQLTYSDGAVEELVAPWAERYSRVTTLMTGFVIKLLQACPTAQSVCTLTRLSWGTVNAIMVSAVERGMLPRTEEEISYLGIDEKSSQKGHSYATILTDIDSSRVLDLIPERKLEAAKTLIGTLTPSQRATVKVVDTVRKQEPRRLSQIGDSALTGSKWAWLKSYPDARSAEAVSFRALNPLNLKTSRAWTIQENFTPFWSYSYKGSAKRFFDAWSTNAMRSRLDPVKKVLKMLRRHETGLLNFSQHNISNACATGFNSAIQLIKANARGFRNFTNYSARILFHCGQLDLGWA